MRGSSSCIADGLVDDHVPLNRIVVINPDVHQSTDISFDDTTPPTTDGEDDTETFFNGDRAATLMTTTTTEDAAMTAKFTESFAAASG